VAAICSTLKILAAPHAWYHSGEDQNRETSFKIKGLQAAVDGWCKIQVLPYHISG